MVYILNDVNFHPKYLNLAYIANVVFFKFLIHIKRRCCATDQFCDSFLNEIYEI